MADVLYLASKNSHKVEEFRSLLKPMGFLVRELPKNFPDSPESGNSFEDNALQKAKYYGDYMDSLMLADDSGLTVDALGGAPGIYSARFAGEHGNDRANNEKLLRLLKAVPASERNASFVCALALWNPRTKEQLIVRGTLAGRIAEAPKGENGFGYDPLFYLPEHNQTVAELKADEKNRISHRARAVEALIRAWRTEGNANLHRQ